MSDAAFRAFYQLLPLIFTVLFIRAIDEQRAHLQDNKWHISLRVRRKALRQINPFILTLTDPFRGLSQEKHHDCSGRRINLANLFQRFISWFAGMVEIERTIRA